MKRLLAIVKLLVFVQYELLLANWRVTRDVIRPSKYLHPRVIRVPLEEGSEVQVATIAGLITLTPGSVTVDIAEDRSAMYVHAMDVPDIEALRQQIKSGFERRVMEVFQ
jgi:multicomponent Na+:H+ antiporter subunit E